MKVAVIHDWLTGMRGGEKVLEGILSLYPGAEVFTLVHIHGSVTPAIENHPIHASFIQSLVGVERHYRKYLPLFPTAIERFDLTGFDLVISSSHAVAKGVRVPPGAVHVCYCHTPMRYIWTSYADYFGPGQTSVPVRLAMATQVGRLRRWDVRSSRRVDRFVANSENVAGRIRRIYDRDAVVIHPWVDHAFFTPGAVSEGDYFLMVTALVPYKRVDLALDAFRGLSARLIIGGSGPGLDRLRGLAPPNVEFRGRIDDDTLRDLYRGCRGLIFPTNEDFGIVPLEAMACGRPVIALGEGGALETVVDGVTGCFFTPQTPEALRQSLERFDPHRYDPERIRAHALTFDRGEFLREFEAVVESALQARARTIVLTERGS